MADASIADTVVFPVLVVYDREVSISEKSVKWYDIVNNNSHIQGKYTVHILPEGCVPFDLIVVSELTFIVPSN